MEGLKQMNLKDLMDNYVLWVAVASWLLAQFLKVFFYALRYRTFSLERLLGAGGMPSSHTSTVCGLTVAVARVCGLGAPMFAIALGVAGVGMYDASGVRRAAGEQAKVLNRLVFERHGPDETEKMLKELLGHTPLEVFGGAVLGILLALIIPMPV